MDLTPGVLLPRQSTPTTCGSACLVVARALADPAFDTWLRSGDGGGRRGLLTGDTPAERFAAYEALVKRRTTGPRGLLGVQLPWPAALGTPPWGAAAELAACAGRRCGVVVTRHLDAPARARALQESLSAGVALLYTGSTTLPRHVVLLAATGDGPVVYEPSRGAVVPADVKALARDCSSLGGWPNLWCAVRPAVGRPWSIS